MTFMQTAFNLVLNMFWRPNRWHLPVFNVVLYSLSWYRRPFHRCICINLLWLTDRMWVVVCFSQCRWRILRTQVMCLVVLYAHAIRVSKPGIHCWCLLPVLPVDVVCVLCSQVFIADACYLYYLLMCMCRCCDMLLTECHVWVQHFHRCIYMPFFSRQWLAAVWHFNCPQSVWHCWLDLHSNSG